MFYIFLLWHLYYTYPFLTRFITTFTIVINIKTKYFIILKYFYTLKILRYSIHKFICNKSHSDEVMTVFLHNRKDTEIKRLFYAFVPSLMMGRWRPNHVTVEVLRGQSIKKPNFFNLLLYLQLSQTCLLQSTPLHSWYTAPNFFFSFWNASWNVVFRDGARVPQWIFFHLLYRLKSATFR